nr:uncharacterized protein LOC113823027 [Penaeus vannamei]
MLKWYRDNFCGLLFLSVFLLIPLLTFIPVLRPSGQGSATFLRQFGDEKKSDRHADTTTSEQEQKFAFAETSKPQESYTGPRFHENTDALLRQVESDVYHTRQFVLAQLRRLQTQAASETTRKNFINVIEDVKHYFSVTQSDLWRFRKSPVFTLGRRVRRRKLTSLVQNRIPRVAESRGL